MGGTGRGRDLPRVIASPVNGITLCGSWSTGCHGWAEYHRTAAALLGWSVSRISTSDARAAIGLLESTPVLGIYLSRADWWLLSEDTFSMAHEAPFDLREITSRDHLAADTARQLTTT